MLFVFQIRQEIATVSKLRHTANQSLLNEIPEIVETQYKFAALKSKATRLLHKSRLLSIERMEKFGEADGGGGGRGGGGG